MKVEASRPAGASGVRGGAKAKGSGFAENLHVEAEAAPAAVGSTPTVSGIEALFALQEVATQTDGRSKGLDHAGLLLDRLDELRRGLLLGHVSRDKLADLARLCRDGHAQVEDPRIRDLLGDIELRALIELEKLNSPAG
jgi:hypothetical protein